jgi:hypothetical protein
MITPYISYNKLCDNGGGTADEFLSFATSE